jgi:uncharacterized membrane protein YczE
MTENNRRWGVFLRRLNRLNAGLLLYALGIVLTMKAGLGYGPWEVFHAGVGLTVGMSIGKVSIVAGIGLGLVAVLLGEKLGLGTILNMVMIGLYMDWILAIPRLPAARGWLGGLALMAAGLFTIALASYFYIGSGFGAGPRDSLMVGFRRKTGLAVGLCRSLIEGSAVICGALLGGRWGAGTLIAAVAIGFCIQVTFRALRFDPTQVQHETLDATWKQLAGRACLAEPGAFLKALTPEAKIALGGAMLEIPRLPFRVGRESRHERRAPEPGGAPAGVPNNDLYLRETDPEINVSREHFLIDRGEGGYELTDRGSSCGTLVEGDRLGGRHQGGRRSLADGDVIVVGTSRSRYVFKFLLAALT